MRDPSPILVFVSGMIALMLMFAGVVWMGPRIIPGQFDQCQIELRKAQPNCSTQTRGGFTYVRDSRCVQPSKGMLLLAQDASGWWRIAKLPAPKPPTIESAEPNEQP